MTTPNIPQYQVARNGQVVGQFSTEEIKWKNSSGELLESDHVYTGGFNNWKTIAEVPELKPSSPATSPLPVSSPTEQIGSAGMKLNITRQGEQFGPFSLEEVNQHLAKGALLPSDFAWEEGMPDWVSLSQIPGVGEPATPTIPVEENTTKLLRKALFSSPWGAIKGFFKDLKEYYRTIFKQIRHPVFSVKEDQGIYFGDIVLVKMSVSLYITLVLAGMTITELSGKATMGNMAVAAMNMLGLLVFFGSIWCAMWIGRIWMKWAKPSFSRRQIDKMFVYEACVVFAMVLPLLLTENPIALMVCWGLAFFHPFYMFFRINKVQATNILVRLCIGGMLSFGFSCSFMAQLGIGWVTAADQDEIAAEGATPIEESGKSGISEKKKKSGSSLATPVIKSTSP